MRRTVLWILGVAGGLVAAILIAVAIAVATVDVKTLVGPVTARVKADTGRDLVFNGPIDVSVSLEPSIVAHDVTFGNAPWSAAPQMIRAREVDLKVRLLPLIQRRFEIVEVVLVEPEIALERDKAGRANWQFEAAGSPKTPPPAPAPAASPPEVAAAGALSIGNVSIVGGTLVYRDGASAATTRVAIERLSVRSRAGDAPIAAQFKGTIDDVPVSLSGDLGPLDALRAGRWPYPVAVQGDVAGKPAKASTKIAVTDNATALDALDVVWGALAVKGNVRIVRDGARSRYEFSLSAPSWTVGDATVVAAAFSGAARAAAEAKPAPPSRWLVSDRPIALDAVKSLDLRGRVAVDELALGPGTTLRAVRLAAEGRDGKLDVTSFDANAYGGTLKGTAAIDATGQAAPAVRLRIDGRDLDLAALLAAIGEKREVRGGKTTLAIDIATRGRSLHEWAAAATGQVLVTIGPATLVNTRLDVNDVLDSLAGSVNPWRGRDPSTELVCAVIRLPFRDGIAQVDRSIAMQTQKIGVSASGTLDMRDERLDFTLRPRINEGIPIDIPQMAELVRFTGPLAHPAVKVDAVASAAAIAKIGAAIGTGGLSMLGTSLLTKATDGGPPCDVALGRAPAAKPAARDAPSADTAAAKQENVPADLGKALGKLFGGK